MELCGNKEIAMRAAEFKKQREEKSKIWQGQMLADVLERDLMEEMRNVEMGDRNFDFFGGCWKGWEIFISI